MTTNNVVGFFIKLATILYALGSTVNAEAAEGPITAVHALVQIPEGLPVSYDPSLVDDTQFKDAVLSDHNVRLLRPLALPYIITCISVPRQRCLFGAHV